MLLAPPPWRLAAKFASPPAIQARRGIACQWRWWVVLWTYAVRGDCTMALVRRSYAVDESEILFHNGTLQTLHMRVTCRVSGAGVQHGGTRRMYGSFPLGP